MNWFQRFIEKVTGKADLRKRLENVYLEMSQLYKDRDSEIAVLNNVIGDLQSQRLYTFEIEFDNGSIHTVHAHDYYAKEDNLVFTKRVQCNGDWPYRIVDVFRTKLPWLEVSLADEKRDNIND